ncbi:MAG TPA: tetratricopeptide repeat protein [Bacteriovoracaceae bacterium]|nr:tetratricopeptide repeat protein [Bacteriovoracaceae bacterium]
MSIKLPKTLLFILSFCVGLLLYVPSITGTPIWDDMPFWFGDPAMYQDFSYLRIWTNYGWPFSVTFQKLALAVFKDQYVFYHVINFLLHFVNSLLVYSLGRRLRLKHPSIYFLLFFLHPVGVTSVAWMIQVKTLLCFGFALSALLAYFKGLKDVRWMALSWVLFFLSVTSKSSSLTLPVILLLISYRHFKFRKLHHVLPFLLISAWSGHRVLSSALTQEGVQSAKVVNDFKKPVAAPPLVSAGATVKKAPPLVSAKKIETPVAETTKVVPKPTVTVNHTQVPGKLSLLKSDGDLLLQTMFYYFWQSVLPLHTQPVKGLNFDDPGGKELTHLIFLVLLLILFRKQSLLLYLAAAHLLLIPFLGLIPAPFMNVTWVSDQHLYLILPAFIGFWLKLLEKISWKHSSSIPVVFLLFYCYKTFEANRWYKNQFVFYQSSLEYNPLNAPIAYNLAYAHLHAGQWIDAYNVVEGVTSLATQEPLLKKNIYYPHVESLYRQMTSTMEHK